MVALSARRLVWAATSWIILTTSPIFCEAPAKPSMTPKASPASSTARSVRLAEWPACCPISLIEADSSSAAEATVCTLMVESRAASDASATRSPAWADLSVMARARSSMAEAAASNSSAAFLILPSRVAAIANRPERRSVSACALACCCTDSSRRISRAFCLKTETAWAILPISSWRDISAMSSSSCPPASLPMRWPNASSGRVMERPTTTLTPIDSTTSSPIARATSIWIVRNCVSTSSI